MRSFLSFSFLFLFLLICGCGGPAISNRSTTSSGSYYTGVYPSAAELTGSNYTQTEVNSRCAAAWAYFKSSLVTASGAVLHTDDNNVVSEGQSYGMFLAVENNDQTTFDKIWNWTRTYMQAPHPQGLFCWRTALDGTITGSDSATDAEEMIALSLFFASHRWGDKAAPYDYSVQAQSILNKILSYEVTADDCLAIAPTVLDGFNASYFMPAFYRLFAVYTGDTRWNRIASKSYDLIFVCLQSQYQNADNGLVADFFKKDGTPGYPGITDSQYFSYDAMRTPWHIALDQVWFGTEARSKSYINKIIGSFFGPIYSSFGSRYGLNGSKLANDHEVSFIGSFAGGAMGGDSETNKANLLNHLMAQPDATGQYRYYDICWQNFGLLLVSGNLKIY